MASVWTVQDKHSIIESDPDETLEPRAELVIKSLRFDHASGAYSVGGGTAVDLAAHGFSDIAAVIPPAVSTEGWVCLPVISGTTVKFLVYIGDYNNAADGPLIEATAGNTVAIDAMPCTVIGRARKNFPAYA